MSQESALAKARTLRTALLDHGVPEVSIELQIGRPVSGDRWDHLNIKTNFSHHIVSYYSASNLTPGLHVVKAGRSDLPGPLCNGYGGFDLTARIICMGLANHPGVGGPYTVNGFTIPKDSARPYAFGWEFEGGVRESDWDRTLRNPRNGRTMTFREFMGRCGAGLQDFANLPSSAHMEHSTWTTRKNDRLNYSRDAKDGIAEIRRYVNSLPVPPHDPNDKRPRNSLGQLSMSYAALIYALDHEVSDTYQAYVDSAMASLQALGFGRSYDAPYSQAEFRTTWYTFVSEIKASANRYAFEYFVDRCGFWPPDTNDWPANAQDR